MPRDIVRWMQAFFLPLAQSRQEAQWSPPVDIYRTPRGWLLKFDLAGVRPGDIRIDVHGSRLTVSGLRRDFCVEEHGYAQYRMEIAYNQFERTVELPVDLNHAHIDLDYREGMLLVDVVTNR
ncbi:MAG: Hsp20/alpha crystallin family protein [Gemmatales bacterium]|nr:Hsp20/alpha crystallin family protein [Gemmatales bacterium]MDW7995155.1 Hsp20/alpha crystallin family protein [Gemmatales bacterium]